MASIRHSGADYLAYALLDAVIDGFFPVLENLGERLANLEDAVLAAPTRSILAEIYAVRRTLLALHRSLWPLREAVHAFGRTESTLMTEQTRLFLRDCYDHVLQVMDVLENYRELTNGLMEMYLSAQSHHLNEVMKVLAVISTIFMPLSFIASIYGMNFNTGEKSLEHARVKLGLGVSVCPRAHGCWLRCLCSSFSGVKAGVIRSVVWRPQLC